MALDIIRPVDRTSSAARVKPYDPNEKRKRDETQQKYEKVKKKVEASIAQEAEVEKVRRPYNMLRPQLSINQYNSKIQEYDFLSKDSIQTVCYNFVVYLWMYDKKYQELDDDFVIDRKSKFFGEYGEKLLNLELEKIEKDTGEFTGLDEIIEAKKIVYEKLHKFLVFADDYMSYLIHTYPKEWTDMKNDLFYNPKERKDLNIVSIRETFFVKCLKNLFKEKGEANVGI